MEDCEKRDKGTVAFYVFRVTLDKEKVKMLIPLVSFRSGNAGK